MTERTVSVQPYVRRAPRDPYAEIRDRTTENLRTFVAVKQMEKDIAEIVARSLAEKPRVRVPAGRA